MGKMRRKETCLTPKDKVNMNMTACLNRIMLKVYNDNYDENITEDLKNDFNYVHEKFKLSHEEAVLLSLILENSNGFGACDDDDLANYIGCTNIEFMIFKNHLQSLIKKRIIRFTRNKEAYKITKEAREAIIQDQEFTKKSFAGKSVDDIFTEFRQIFKDFRDEEIDTEMLLDDLNMLIDLNSDCKFAQKILDCGIRKCSKTQQRIFIYLCHQYVNWGTTEIDFGNLSDFVAEREDEQRFFRMFQGEKHLFQELGLVTFGYNDELMDKRSIALSEKVKETFFTEVEIYCDNDISGQQDMTSHEQIKQKELFYNTTESRQIERLEELLDNEHFNGIQSRLEQMGMRKGFNIILYGGPGTGKTETTLQLARKTQRDVLSIDVSKVKSKWVGDSEKAVKDIFKKYSKLCKTKERKPILFFNEADAIFGKRMENVESAVAQMLNSMQNIILQEMENLDGIMVATTNLHGNLDPAFERRFIYKVELEQPNSEVRTKIWASMIPGLKEDDYIELGRRYNFSGGQIENIARKSAVDYILTGKNISMELVCRCCEEEMFKSKVKRVGF